MVQTGSGIAVAAANGRKAAEDVPKLLACLVLVGISWAMVVCNIIINIRNGQRLSIDDHGWLMNGVIVGTLSLAPTAAVGFAGYRWKRGGRGLAALAALAAVPLVVFNLWSASEYWAIRCSAASSSRSSVSRAISRLPRYPMPRSFAPSAKP